MASDDLTAEEVRSLLDYDPATGVLSWKTRVGGRSAGTKALSKDEKGYGRVRIRYRMYKAHRVVWAHFYGYWPDHEVDHINGIVGDNRVENLRDVSKNTNMQNRKRAQKNNRIGLLGVAPADSKRNPWRATIKPLTGPTRHLGCFKTPEEAHAAYVEAKRLLHEGCTI